MFTDAEIYYTTIQYTYIQHYIFLDWHICPCDTTQEVICPKSIVQFTMAADLGHPPSLKGQILQQLQKPLTVAPPMYVRSTYQGPTCSTTCSELSHFHLVTICKIHHMQISHVSEGDGTFLDSLSARASVLKGLKKNTSLKFCKKKNFKILKSVIKPFALYGESLQVLKSQRSKSVEGSFSLL